MNIWKATNELERIFEHLEGDKYILRDVVQIPAGDRIVRKFTGAWITFAGMVFIEDGGYAKRHKRKIISATFQTLALWLAAIGTLAAGVYGIVELCKNYLPRCIPIQSLAASFASGAISVGLVWTASVWLRRKMR